MKRVMLLVLIFAFISSSFSLTIVTSGNFNLNFEYKNSTKMDVVVTMPNNWSVLSIEVNNAIVTKKEIVIKNIDNQTVKGVHLELINVKNMKGHITILPNSNGIIKLYYINSNGTFKREIIYVKYTGGSIIIPYLLAVLPFITYYSVERWSRNDEK